MTGLPLATIEVTFSSVFPFQIKSTIAHTKPAIPLMQVARFETEVTGNNLHPKLETSYTVVPQHFITTCSGCASTLWHFVQHQICDLGFWNTAAGENTHTCETGEPREHHEHVNSLYPMQFMHTLLAILYIHLPQSRVTDYCMLTLYLIWFSNTDVFSCAFVLNSNHSAFLFPYFVTHFSTQFFFLFFLLRPHSNKVDTQSEAFWK